MQIFKNNPDPKGTQLVLIKEDQWDKHISQSSLTTQEWAKQHIEKVTSGDVLLCPATPNEPMQAFCCIAEPLDMWSLAHLPAALPAGDYYFADKEPAAEALLGWGLAQYRFNAYLNEKDQPARILHLKDEETTASVNAKLEAHNLVRELINIPTNDMGPSHLAKRAKVLAVQYNADFSEIVGDDLLKENYPLVHAVGRAAENKPRLIDMRWGDDKHPKLTLVGKGVCFDTGGLDIKPYSSMKLMKKDMGGAAYVLGLAHRVMHENLPVRLRVLIPAVENSIADNAFRPQDILTARDGTTVEIGSTDAEGRLILADALVEADSESPDLIIDIATLTGAARVALGTEVPALFAKHDEDARDIMRLSLEKKDALWPLPLWEPYTDNVRSSFAELTNTPTTSFGGAIHAALFLKHFVPNTEHWLHIDTMAWNLSSKPGRPKGGEALGLHALYAWLEKRYTS